jgi:hypothetical protein
MQVTGINVSGNGDSIRVWDFSKSHWEINRTKQKTAKMNFRKQITKLKEQHAYQEKLNTDYENWRRCFGPRVR